MDSWAIGPYGAFGLYGLNVNDGDINEPGNKTRFYVTKGGSWKSSPKSTKISFKHMVKPDFKNRTFGFRCAKSIENEAK